MSQSIQHAYKCVKPILPEAKTLVFESSDDGMSMKYMKKDEYYDTWDEDEIGYTQSAIGDSGSPYMIKETGTGGEAQYTFVAIVSGYFYSDQAAGTYMKGRSTQCREVASKLTKEILLWIKQWAGITPT